MATERRTAWRRLARQSAAAGERKSVIAHRHYTYHLSPASLSADGRSAARASINGDAATAAPSAKPEKY